MAAGQQSTPTLNAIGLIEAIMVNRPRFKQRHGENWAKAAKKQQKNQSEDDKRYVSAIEKIGSCKLSEYDKKYITNTSRASVAQSNKQILATLDYCVEEMFKDGTITWVKISVILILLADIVGECIPGKIAGREALLTGWCEQVFKRDPLFANQKPSICVMNWIVTQGGSVSLLSFADSLQLPQPAIQESRRLPTTYKPFQLSGQAAVAKSSAVGEPDARYSVLPVEMQPDIEADSPTDSSIQYTVATYETQRDPGAKAIPGAGRPPITLVIHTQPPSTLNVDANEKKVTITLTNKIAAVVAQDTITSELPVASTTPLPQHKEPIPSTSGAQTPGHSSPQPQAPQKSSAKLSTQPAASSEQQQPSKKANLAFHSGMCPCGASISAEAQQTMEKCTNCGLLWCLVGGCRTHHKTPRICKNHQEQMHSMPTLPTRAIVRLIFNTRTGIVCNCCGVDTPVMGNSDTLAKCRLCGKMWCLVPNCGQSRKDKALCIQHQVTSHVPPALLVPTTHLPSFCSTCGTRRTPTQASQKSLSCRVCGHHLCFYNSCTYETVKYHACAQHIARQHQND